MSIVIVEKMETKYDDNLAYFIAFCIETFKNAQGITGEEASHIFSETGLIDFLAENYEPIHTQSPQWILEEINEYLSAHDKKYETLSW